MLPRDVDAVRGAVVVDDLRVIERDVRRPAVEIVDGVTPFAHHLSHQTVGDTYGGGGVVHESGLHLLPAGAEVGERRRRERNDIELASFAFSRSEFPHGTFLASGLGYQVLVLTAVVLFQPLRFYTEADHAYCDNRRHDRHDGDGRHQDPFPRGHQKLPSYMGQIARATRLQTSFRDLWHNAMLSSGRIFGSSEVVPTAADGASGAAQDCQDRAVDEREDS